MLTGMRIIGIDTSLRLNVWGSVANLIVTCAGRILDESGSLRPFVFTVNGASDRTLKTLDSPIQAGTLVSLQVFASAGTPKRGQCFVQVQLTQGTTGATLAFDTLLADYVTAVQPIAWPGSLIRSSIDGPGVLRSITGTDPAAGVEIGEVVPVGARWRFIGLFSTLLTSAVVANRFPRFTFDDGAAVYFAAGSSPAHVASTAVNYILGETGYSPTAIGATMSLPTPYALALSAGHRIKSLTAALDVGDNWAAPQYLVEEWLEP